jgi:hypothetical protein
MMGNTVKSRVLIIHDGPPRYYWNIVESGVKHNNSNRKYINNDYILYILQVLGVVLPWFAICIKSVSPIKNEI